VRAPWGHGAPPETRQGGDRGRSGTIGGGGAAGWRAGDLPASPRRPLRVAAPSPAPKPPRCAEPGPPAPGAQLTQAPGARADVTLGHVCGRRGARGLPQSPPPAPGAGPARLRGCVRPAGSLEPGNPGAREPGREGDRSPGARPCRRDRVSGAPATPWAPRGSEPRLHPHRGRAGRGAGSRGFSRVESPGERGGTRRLGPAPQAPLSRSASGGEGTPGSRPAGRYEVNHLLPSAADLTQAPFNRASQAQQVARGHGGRKGSARSLRMPPADRKPLPPPPQQKGCGLRREASPSPSPGQGFWACRRGQASLAWTTG
jgi:hypothetical protein